MTKVFNKRAKGGTLAALGAISFGAAAQEIPNAVVRDDDVYDLAEGAAWEVLPNGSARVIDASGNVTIVQYQHYVLANGAIYLQRDLFWITSSAIVSVAVVTSVLIGGAVWALGSEPSTDTIPPVITSGTTATVAEDATPAVSITTVAASDVEGLASAPFSIMGGTGSGLFVIDPVSGVISLASGASLDFESTTSYTLDIQVIDQAGNTATQTITITVTDVNEPPVATGEATNLNEDDTSVAVSITPGESDPDGDALTYSIVTLPANGTLFASGVAVTAGMVLTAAQLGALTYTPNANYNGTDSFTYSVSDGTAPAVTATHTLNVTPVNDAPVAAGESTTLAATDTNVAITITTGDSDIDGDTLTYSIATLPATGTLFASGVAVTAGMVLTAAQLGALTYTPSGSTASESFTYTLSDGTVTSAAQTHTLTITGVNVAPTVSQATLTLNCGDWVEGTAITNIDFSTYFSDSDGDALTYAISGLPVGTGLSLNTSTGILSGTPTLADVTTALSLTVSATDTGGSNTATNMTVAGDVALNHDYGRGYTTATTQAGTDCVDTISFGPATGGGNAMSWALGAGADVVNFADQGTDVADGAGADDFASSTLFAGVGYGSGTFMIDTGADNDTLNLGDSNLSTGFTLNPFGPQTSATNNSILTGTGDDTITGVMLVAGNTASGPDDLGTTIDMGAGADTFTLTEGVGLIRQGTLNFQLNMGTADNAADTVSIGTAATFNGSGSAHIGLAGTSTLNWNVQTGGGDDTVSLVGERVGLVFAGNAGEIIDQDWTLDTGAGADTVTIDSNEGLHTELAEATSTVDILIALGTGADVLTIGTSDAASDFGDSFVSGTAAASQISKTVDLGADTDKDTVILLTEFRGFEISNFNDASDAGTDDEISFSSTGVAALTDLVLTQVGTDVQVQSVATELFLGTPRSIIDFTINDAVVADVSGLFTF